MNTTSILPTVKLAIAQHLNVITDTILEVQEWASVYFVRVAGQRARFVSKSVCDAAHRLSALVQQSAVIRGTEALKRLGDWAAGRSNEHAAPRPKPTVIKEGRFRGISLD